MNVPEAGCAEGAADGLTDTGEGNGGYGIEIPRAGSAPAVTGAVAAGAAAGAAIGSIAGGSIKRIKQPEPFTKKKQDPSTDIEAQLEAAHETFKAVQ